MSSVPESDWKLFRQLREAALERFSQRVLEEIEAIQHDASRSWHDRYVATYRLIQDRDTQLANAFDNPKRSQMVVQLAVILRNDLVEPGELNGFSQQTQDTVKFLARG